MEHCDNLVRVHQRTGGDSKGQRRYEVSVSRARVQDTTRYILPQNTPASSDSKYGFALLQDNVIFEICKFSTLNAENSRKLLQSAGFDPRLCWTWTNGTCGGRVAILKPNEAVFLSFPTVSFR